MRFYTKEYYRLMMSLDAAEVYEPVVDREYSDEDIAELYQKALDKYIEEERAAHDEPPEFDMEESGDPEYIGILRAMLDEYENRGPFDEEEAREEFEELYRANLEEPDEDLPAWVWETVDPRLPAMYFLPEKVYERLAAEDRANGEKFEELDEAADEAYDEMMDDMPEEYEELMETLEELEDADVLSADVSDGEIVLTLEGWDEDGDEAVFTIRFDGAELIENEGLEVHCEEDEDGDSESDCELLYSELWFDEGMPEVHMLFDNNGLKYLTFRCEDAYVYQKAGE